MPGSAFIFSSGAGTITYSANELLYVSNHQPSWTAAQGIVTGENSDIAYSELSSTPSSTIVQQFGLAQCLCDTSSGSSCVVPIGSYLGSCTGCTAAPSGSGCVLACASCGEINGTQNANPSLQLPCVGSLTNGSISNSNGTLQLQCSFIPSGDAGTSIDGGCGSTCATPGGSYQGSCTGCAAEPSGSGCVLTCTSCTETDGSQNPSPSLTLPCSGEIENDNGVLRCSEGTSNDAGSRTTDGGSSSDQDGSISEADADSGLSDAEPSADATRSGGLSDGGSSDGATNSGGSSEGGSSGGGGVSAPGSSSSGHGCSLSALHAASPTPSLASLAIAFLISCGRRRKREYGGKRPYGLGPQVRIWSLSLVAGSVPTLLTVQASALADGASVGQVRRVGSAKKPPGVPAEYIITPNGFFHPSCVVTLAPDERLDPDLVVRGLDGVARASVPSCAYPRFDFRGESVPSSATSKVAAPASMPETGPWNGYVAFYEYHYDGNAWGTSLSNIWVVPPSPTTVGDGEVVYLWNGILTSNALLQPVLGFNSDSVGTWNIASWNCCTSGIMGESAAVTVSPGDVIRGTVTGADCDSSGVCQSYTVTTTNMTCGQSVVLNTTSPNGAPDAIFPGVLETYGVTSCNMFPPNGEVAFYDSTLTDQSGNPVSVPYEAATLLDPDPSLPTDCGYQGEASGSTYTLVFSHSPTEYPGLGADQCCLTPSGSYSGTCTGCVAGSAGADASACVLTCESCTEIDGAQSPGPTSLVLPCLGSISNDNGVLRCDPGDSDDAGMVGGDDGGNGAGGDDAGNGPNGRDAGPVGGDDAGTRSGPTDSGGGDSVASAVSTTDATIESGTGSGPADDAGSGRMPDGTSAGAIGCGCVAAGAPWSAAGENSLAGLLALIGVFGLGAGRKARVRSVPGHRVATGSRHSSRPPGLPSTSTIHSDIGIAFSVTAIRLPLPETATLPNHRSAVPARRRPWPPRSDS